MSKVLGPRETVPVREILRMGSFWLAMIGVLLLGVCGVMSGLAS